MRRFALVVLLALIAIGAVVHFWPDDGQERATRSTLDAPPRQPISQQPARLGSAAQDPRLAQDSAPQRSPPTQAITTPRSPLVIDVRAPATVHSGESFQATVEVQATGELQQLAFSVGYNQRVLQLVGSTAGTFVEQGGLSAQFGAQEPSDGTIVVMVDLSSGRPISGFGTIAVFDFQALKAGVSALTVHSVTFIDGGRQDTLTEGSIHQGTVTID